MLRNYLPRVAATSRIAVSLNNPPGARTGRCAPERRSSRDMMLTVSKHAGLSNSAPRGGMAAPSLGLLKRTPILLIPPIVARVIAGVAIVILQSVWDAYQAEAAKLARHYGSAEQQKQLKLTNEEALQILNMPAHTKMPLSLQDTKRVKENFEALFQKATQVDSPYLQGKFSGAYRLLADPNWDALEWEEASKEESQDAGRQQ